MEPDLTEPTLTEPPYYWVAQLTVAEDDLTMLGTAALANSAERIEFYRDQHSFTRPDKPGLWCKVLKNWPGAEKVSSRIFGPSYPSRIFYERTTYASFRAFCVEEPIGEGEYFKAMSKWYLVHPDGDQLLSPHSEMEKMIIQADGSVEISGRNYGVHTRRAQTQRLSMAPLTPNYPFHIAEESPLRAEPIETTLDSKMSSCTPNTGSVLVDAAKNAALRVAVNETCEGLLDICAKVGKDVPAVASLLESNLGRQLVLLSAISGVHLASFAGLTSLSESAAFQKISSVVAENAMAAMIGPEAEKFRKALTESGKFLEAVVPASDLSFPSLEEVEIQSAYA